MRSEPMREMAAMGVSQMLCREPGDVVEERVGRGVEYLVLSEGFESEGFVFD